MRRAIKEAQVLRNLKKEDVLDFFGTYVKKGGQSRRLLTSQVFPQAQREKLASSQGPASNPNYAEQLVTNEVSFRGNRPTF